MRSSRLDRRSGVTAIERQVLDTVAKAAMAIDKLLIDPAHMADMEVIPTPPLLRFPSAQSQVPQVKDPRALVVQHQGQTMQPNMLNIMEAKILMQLMEAMQRRSQLQALPFKC
jgi:hypothetical protein